MFNHKIYLSYIAEKDAVSKLLDCVFVDPDLFMLDCLLWAKTFNGVVIKPQYICSKKDYYQLKSKIDKNVDIIINNSTSCSKYDTALKIHDILCKNIKYQNDGGRNRHHISGTFLERLAVCDGYAKAYKYILDKIGIPCRVITGKTEPHIISNDDTHAWNIIKVFEEWRHVDLAFDATISSEHQIFRDYFLKTSGEIKSDHKFSIESNFLA